MMYTPQNKLAEIDTSETNRVLVFGDIHGDLRALEEGLRQVSDGDLGIFLGDYADRGPQGVEVIEKIDKCISEEPEKYIALKGNHEDYLDNGEPMFAPWTLIQDVERQGESWEAYFPRLTFFFDKLYLAALIPGYSLFVHGGIWSGISSKEDLAYPEPETEANVLWSDPVEGSGEQPNPRGAGYIFGEDITRTVLQKLGVNRLFRGHEPRKAAVGPAVEQGGSVVTTSCTGVYGGKPFIVALETARFPETPEELTASTIFL